MGKEVKRGKGLGIKPISNKIVFSSYIQKENGLRIITGKEIDLTDEAIYCVYEWMKRGLEKNKKNSTQEVTFDDGYTLVMYRTGDFEKIKEKLEMKTNKRKKVNK